MKVSEGLWGEQSLQLTVQLYLKKSLNILFLFSNL